METIPQERLQNAIDKVLAMAGPGDSIGIERNRRVYYKPKDGAWQLVKTIHWPKTKPHDILDDYEWCGDVLQISNLEPPPVPKSWLGHRIDDFSGGVVMT